MTNSVEIKNLDLNFGSVKVLKQLNLDIAEGEFLVLLGSSGCGKSTLLNCIAGLLEVTDGQIFIKGQNVTWAEPSDRGIGMVFQSYALYPQMTVRGNLSFGLKNAKIPKDEIAKRVARAADILQIDFIGSPSMNFIEGKLEGGVFAGGDLTLAVDGYKFEGATAPDTAATIGIRPEHIITGELVAKAPHKMDMVVDLVEPMGSDTLVYTTLNGATFRIRMDGQAIVKKGETLTVGIDPARASLFDTKSENRL